ncbi:MAG: hypothetical protein FVQ81_04605 [Candidatus Glassbacteria bacterium]|nr:hypothetical protein [Candidatus Glassbacteria bacterium]
MTRLEPKLAICALTVCLLLPSLSRAMTFLYTGQARSSLYSYEHLHHDDLAESDENYRFYQYLRLKLKGVGEKNSVSFNTYMRLSDDLSVDYSSDPNWRMYNAYLQWDTRGGKLSVGRQWLHLGPGSMTLDGVKLELSKSPKFKFTGYVGSESPFSRKFDSRGYDRAGSGGLYVRVKPVSELTIGAGWYQKNRYGETAFREFGVNADATLPNGFKLYSRLDFNMLTDQIQKGQVRLRYQGHKKFNFFGEFKHYQPRLFYQSYYRRKFEPEGNNQLRGGVNIFLKNEVSLNASYSSIMMEDETSGYLTLGASGPYGWANYYMGHGFGGDEDGFALGGSLPLAHHKFELFGTFDYSRFRYYELDNESDRDYLFSTIFGMHWKPSEVVEAGIEFEDVNNDMFGKDWRVLINLNVNFTSAFRHTTSMGHENH